MYFSFYVSLQNQVVADDKSPTAIPSDVQLFEAFSMQIANIVQVAIVSLFSTNGLGNIYS